MTNLFVLFILQPGATKKSSSYLVSFATEYKQGDRYTTKLEVPLDDVETQTYYWTGSKAFVAYKSAIHTICKKVETDKIFISLSTVFSQMDKAEFYVGYFQFYFRFASHLN